MNIITIVVAYTDFHSAQQYSVQCTILLGAGYTNYLIAQQSQRLVTGRISRSDSSSEYSEDHYTDLRAISIK